MLDKVSPSSLVRASLDPAPSIKDQERKVKIIAWLLPRFDKGLSDPKKYAALIGKVEAYCLNCGSRLGGDRGDAEPDFNTQFCSKGCYEKFPYHD